MTQKPGLSGIPRKDFAWTRVDLQTLDLSGLRAAVVGGTGGLGRALAVRLAARGAEVTVVGQTFRDEGVKGLSFLKADLGLMKEARRVGRELPAEQLDLVVLTTGIFAAPTREETPEGIERDFAISYLCRQVLVQELAPRLGKGRGASKAKPRVFVMGFPGTNEAGLPDDLNAEKAYAATAVHMNTVACNEALVLDGARRYPEVEFFGLNPGLVKTNIRANFLGSGSWKHRLAEFVIGLFNPTPELYGDRTAPLLVSPDLAGRSGAMFNQKGVPIEASAVLTPSHVERLMRGSEALLAKVPG